MGEVIKIPWGCWDMNGTWYPNLNLSMSPEEQYRQNLKNGYAGTHRNHPKKPKSGSDNSLTSGRSSVSKT